MRFKVGFNVFFSDSANGAAKIAACPQGLTPVALFEQWKLILQLSRRNAFDLLSKLSWREARRTGNHQVNMVAADRTFQDRHFTAHAALTDNLACSFCRFTTPHRLSVLRHPYKVIRSIVDRMRSRAIVGHFSCSTILQGSLRSFRAEAIRLKAKVLYLAHGK